MLILYSLISHSVDNKDLTELLKLAVAEEIKEAIHHLNNDKKKTLHIKSHTNTSVLFLILSFSSTNK